MAILNASMTIMTTSTAMMEDAMNWESLWDQLGLEVV